MVKKRKIDEEMPEKMVAEVRKKYTPIITARQDRSRVIIQKRIREISTINKLERNSKRRPKLIVITPEMYKERKIDAVSELKQQ